MAAQKLPFDDATDVLCMTECMIAPLLETMMPKLAYFLLLQ